MLSVVIPCLDEAENVKRFEAELVPHLPPNSEIILVDDGSASPLSLSYTEPGSVTFRVVRHERNRGLGAALRTGFSEAKGDWIVTLDADLTFSPALIPALIRRQKETGADLVSGSPWLAASAEVPASRRVPSLLINAFYRGFLSSSLTAYTSIFRLYRASALRGMTVRSDGFEINAELAARFLRARLKVAEIPAELTARRHGQTRLRPLRELRRHLALIARLIWSR